MQLFISMFSAILFLFSLLLTSGEIEARWQTAEDACIEIEFHNHDIVVNANGSSTEIITTQSKILKENGRNIWANYPLIYNSAISGIKIIEAKTIYAGKEYPLDHSLIEDKPLASSPQGFDQYNQLSLAFPNAEIGAQLYLKYQLTNNVPLLENFYDNNFVYGEGGLLSKSTVTLKSELPLYISVNDPDNVLQVTTNMTAPAKSNSASTFTELTINLTKPVLKDVIDEPYNLIAPNLLPWISVSSVNTWQSMANKIGPKYIEVIRQPLPKLLQDIADAAAKYTTDVDKFNAVTSLLAAKIQYMGDWKTVEGKFTPHDLQHIANVQLGDCKDFSVSAGAILHNLGYKVQPVLVKRGALNRQPPTALPSFSQCNHVLLKVTVFNKNTATAAPKIYWLDPTNFVSMADGIFQDISAKPVFVIDPEEPGEDLTPAIDPDHAQLLINQTLDLTEPGNVKAKGTVTLKGEYANQITGAQLMASDETIRNVIFSIIGNEFIEAKKSISLPDLKSRIVKDLNFDFEYVQNDSLIKTNFGNGIICPTPVDWISNFINVKTDQISDVHLTNPRTIKITTQIHGFPVKKGDTLDYQISNRWLDLTRSIKSSTGITTIDDNIKIKDYFIYNKDIKSQEYVSFKQELAKNFRNVVLISSQD